MAAIMKRELTLRRRTSAFVMGNLQTPDFALEERNPLVNAVASNTEEIFFQKELEYLHVSEEWKKEFNPVCERNKVLMIESVRDPNKMRPLLGRNCSHNFCPNGSECVQGKRLAYCCGVTNPPKGMYPVRREELFAK
ncbi:hypothetical protein ANCCAN_05410 [Ancylostoma caninum]|uniref:Uncharacterized protein n=1 Tax=Ancylostoma caninum TaxID=29170 RepID=A0A368GW42_ANCCA|nr:hypothetical protein ANCCAN_05410 [Ancylostoma caninum]